MVAILLLGAVIGAIVYVSRSSRGDSVVSVPALDREETWKLNVRDLRGELVRKASSQRLRSFELRRSEDGRWELADDTSDEPLWTPCEEHLQRPLEDKYRTYNGTS